MLGRLKSCLFDTTLAIVAVIAVLAVYVAVLTVPAVREIVWPSEVPEMVRCLRLPVYAGIIFFVLSALKALVAGKWTYLVKCVVVVLVGAFLGTRVLNPAIFWDDTTQLLLGAVGVFFALVFLVGLGEAPTTVSAPRQAACPVCSGSGVMHGGETCRRCGGSGVA